MPHILPTLVASSLEYAHAVLGPLTSLTVYQIVVTGLALLSLSVAVSDWFSFRRPRRPRSDAAEIGPAPFVSILIPARNEATTITACIRSLRAQDYSGNFEILVLDDQSTDGTSIAIDAAANGDPRVRRLTGGALQPGWKGKPNALRQLASTARGDLLLLTDADCEFLPGALAAAVYYRQVSGADCLSLIPDLVCGSFWEHVIVPLQYDVVFLTLPIRKVFSSKNPAFAAANGAFILVPASTYAAVGGHEQVCAEMAEDIKFAQWIKRSGFRLMYGDGSRIYRVRMYDSLGGIWDGFSKNLFPAMGKNPIILAVWLAFHLTTQVLPFIFLFVALATRTRSMPGFEMPCVQIAIALGIRAALAIRFRSPLWSLLMHPIGWLVTIAIGTNSAYLTYSRKGHTWKGRVYPT